MKKYEVVKSKEEFNEILNSKNMVNNNCFYIYYKDSNYNYSRFGLAVGKKIGNAVTRNYYKRILRDIISKNKFKFKNNLNYIIIIRNNCLNMTYPEIESSLVNLIEKVKL